MRPDNRSVNRRHNQHGKRTAFKLLLARHILVPGQKNIKALLLNQGQQRTVLNTSPGHADNGMDFMMRQQPG